MLDSRPDREGRSPMSFSIKDESQYCRDQGWLVTPLRGKEAFLKDWQNRAQTDPEVTAAMAREGNFGIRLGEVSGNLVDLDLDCEEAVRAAPHILPPTNARFGR